ncbi:MAG: sigma-54 dependent transcriptional regulator [Acidobacteriota bacterium]
MSRAWERGAAARLQDDAETLEREVLAELVGSSPRMVALRDRLARLASRDAPVLVQGPSGTGKELAAQVLHRLSTRWEAELVPVDCGSLSEGVLESELFGHERGAFTSAVGSRSGLFERADGGTLFLDEIAGTTLAFQARLLRALQEGEVRRVGSSQARRVDVRIVAAANRDLWSEVEAGRFREDLYYRLDVLRLDMPPLSERLEDLPELARHLLDGIAERTGETCRLSEPALASLRRHDWPGNVRELRNVLETAVAESVDGVIHHVACRRRLSAVPAMASADETEVETGSEQAYGGDREGTSLAERVAAYEARVVARTLRARKWNRAAAAAALGVSRRTLYDKIQRHGLSPPRAS